MAARGRDLEDRVALVVGAGMPGAIGAAAARALGEAGAKLTIADLPTSKLAEVAKSLRDDGFEVASAEVDVVDEALVKAMVDAAFERYGRLDVIVNLMAATNILHLDREVIGMDIEVWNQQFAVNVRGPMLVCKHALPLMIAQGGGSIVNVSSGQSIRGDAQGPAYAASKAAMNALTRSIATMYGDRGIRCNTIVTGVIATTLMKAIVSPEMARLYEDCSLLGRLGEPEDMADLVVFLASNRSAYITAQTIQCDGGILDNVPVRAGMRAMEKEARALRADNRI